MERKFCYYYWVTEYRQNPRISLPYWSRSLIIIQLIILVAQLLNSSMRLNVIYLIQIQIFTLTLSSQIFSKVSISWILNFWSELRILQLGNRSNKQLVNALPHSKWDKPKSIDIKSTWQNFCLHLNPKRLINIR